MTNYYLHVPVYLYHFLLCLLSSNNVTFIFYFLLNIESETLLRAISKVDDVDYNLLENNCEHFAVWCKTGQMKSFQVRRGLSWLWHLYRL